MVGKSRNTIRGTTRSTTGGGMGGGTVGANPEGEVSLSGKDIIEEALNAQPQEEQLLARHEAESSLANLSHVPGTEPDMTGLGTPVERIAPQVEGSSEERLKKCHTPEEGLGIGAGAHPNLGIKHGRTLKGGEIAGAGASIHPSCQPDQGEKGASDHG